MNVLTLTSSLLALGVAVGSLGIDAQVDPAARPEDSRDEARAALEAARTSGDPETRWNAALLLDRLGEDQDLGRLRERAGDEMVPDETLKPMREALRRLDPFGFRLDQGPALGPNSSFSSTTVRDGVRESVSIQVDAEGRVVAEREKGGEKTRIEADSVEALRRDHPELLEGLPAIGGMRFAITPRLPRQERIESLPQVERPADPSKDPDPSRPRLGVRVAPVKPDVAEYLDLDAGLGLEIVEVLDGTPAVELGLRVRDILIELNGRAIQGVEDVALALRSGEASKLTAKVIRKGQEKSLGRREAR
jgi:hypothetical protein